MKTKSPPQAYSVNQLSKLTGADRRTLDKAVVGLQPAGHRGKSPLYPLSEVEAALKARKAGGSLRDAKLYEEVRKLRLKNDRDEGKLIAVEVIARRLAEVAQGQKDLLRQRLENESPSQLADQKPEPIRIMLKRVVDEVCASMQALVKEWE